MIGFLGCLAGGLGLLQLGMALRPTRPANLRRVSLWAGVALVGLGGSLLAHARQAPPAAQGVLALLFLIFGLLWLAHVWALSRQNTTM